MKKHASSAIGASTMAGQSGSVCEYGIGLHVADHMVMMSNVQTALRLVFPPRCVGCGGLVDSDFGLCGVCWGETPFVGGVVCDGCGVPLPGQNPAEHALCDACMMTVRPWQRGRAALVYTGTARKLVLALKYGDRQDVARLAAKWMALAARPLVRDAMVVAPVPLHWRRFVQRRYNQSALLARALASELGLAQCPDLLQRPKAGGSTQGLGMQERFQRLNGVFRAHPKRQEILAGRPVLLVDDVMTTGATLTAASTACLDAGAAEVYVIVLARAAKDA